MNMSCSFNERPDCCKACVNMDDDSKGDYYCTKSIILPTKKNTCKNQAKQYKNAPAEKKKLIFDKMEPVLIEARRNKLVLAVNNIADALAKEISRRK